MTKHLQINEHSTAHKKNKGQKSNDHLNICKNSLQQNSTTFHNKSLKKLGIEGT
jgi:hypothetical protein